MHSSRLVTMCDWNVLSNTEGECANNLTQPQTFWYINDQQIFNLIQLQLQLNVKNVCMFTGQELGYWPGVALYCAHYSAYAVNEITFCSYL